MTIEEYIIRELPSGVRETALDFVRFLADHGMTFYKDNGAFWKDKIYYWVQIGDECVFFIEIKEAARQDGYWTVWSDDIGSDWLEKASVDDGIREKAWRHADHCGHCGSCGGGKRKVIFGREFSDICGCTFVVEDPAPADLPFLKIIAEIRKNEILCSGK